MGMDVLGYAALAALVLLISWYLYRQYQRRIHAATHHAPELRRQELLHKLTFFLSSLRHIYNMYPTDVLPTTLQAERQAFLETDFRNLTALSALSLSEIEDLFAAVQRECATGKWRGGVTAVEQRVKDAARQAALDQDGHAREAQPGLAPNSRDSR
jgi:hypothetical protein